MIYDKATGNRIPEEHDRDQVDASFADLERAGADPSRFMLMNWDRAGRAWFKNCDTRRYVYIQHGRLVGDAS